MRIHWKRVLAGVLCAAAWCSQLATPGLAQVAPPAVLRIEYENGVRYVYDSVDVPTFATVPTPVSEAVPTFATMVLLADVVAVNGKPAKGIFLTRQTVANLTTNPSAGQAIADAPRTNVVERIVEIQKPDGTPIGSIMALGFNGGEVPPGAPSGAMVGSFAITGGTGAFLGMRGQAADGGDHSKPQRFRERRSSQTASQRRRKSVGCPATDPDDSSGNYKYSHRTGRNSPRLHAGHRGESGNVR